MSRVVWTTIGIEADLTERTWTGVRQFAWGEKCQRLDELAIFVFGSSEFVMLKVSGLKFRFKTETQAIAFRLSHPDHLIDKPTDPTSEKAARVNRLNRLPILEAA
jgi:hypothetical protein